MRMGRGKPGKGFEVRATCYRVRFRWRGKRYSGHVDLKPSAANTKYVERLSAQVRAAIALDTFTFTQFFPGSPEARVEAVAAPVVHAQTFGEAADLWKRTRGAPLSDWQQKKDTLYVKFWKEKIGADRVMARLLPSHVEAVVAEHPWTSAKHRNNLLTSLRGIFDLWVKDDRKNRVSPAADIDNGKVQKKRPDPFDMQEVELILDHMTKHYDPRIAAYFEFAFFAGVRPEEAIALRWPKVDARKRQVLIDVARTARAEKATKNYELRTVDLNQRAWAALERMRPWTSMKVEHDAQGKPLPPHVFENPKTGLPWASEADQRDLYWTPTLKRLRLRHRTAYKARHTCASMYLMAGYDPGWIAQQLGHSERVFWETYAETIKTVRTKRDVHEDFEAKLAALKDQDRVA